MDLKREPSFRLLLAIFQLLFVPPIVTCSIFLLGLSNHNTLIYLFTALFGFLFGAIMGWAFSDAIRSLGKWVWVWPTILLVLLVVHDYQPSSPGRTLDWIWPRWNEQWSGFGYWFLTLPAVASFFYAVGVWAAHRVQGRLGEGNA